MGHKEQLLFAVFIIGIAAIFPRTVIYHPIEDTTGYAMVDNSLETELGDGLTGAVFVPDEEAEANETARRDPRTAVVFTEDAAIATFGRSYEPMSFVSADDPASVTTVYVPASGTLTVATGPYGTVVPAELASVSLQQTIFVYISCIVVLGIMGYVYRRRLPGGKDSGELVYSTLLTNIPLGLVISSLTISAFLPHTTSSDDEVRWTICGTAWLGAIVFAYSLISRIKSAESLSAFHHVTAAAVALALTRTTLVCTTLTGWTVSSGAEKVSPELHYGGESLVIAAGAGIVALIYVLGYAVSEGGGAFLLLAASTAIGYLLAVLIALADMTPGLLIEESREGWWIWGVLVGSAALHVIVSSVFLFLLRNRTDDQGRLRHKFVRGVNVTAWAVLLFGALTATGWLYAVGTDKCKPEYADLVAVGDAGDSALAHANGIDLYDADIVAAVVAKINATFEADTWGDDADVVAAVGEITDAAAAGDPVSVYDLAGALGITHKSPVFVYGNKGEPYLATRGGTCVYTAWFMPAFISLGVYIVMAFLIISAGEGVGRTYRKVYTDMGAVALITVVAVLLLSYTNMHRMHEAIGNAAPGIAPGGRIYEGSGEPFPDFVRDFDFATTDVTVYALSASLALAVSIIAMFVGTRVHAAAYGNEKSDTNLHYMNILYESPAFIAFGYAMAVGTAALINLIAWEWSDLDTAGVEYVMLASTIGLLHGVWYMFGGSAGMGSGYTPLTRASLATAVVYTLSSQFTPMHVSLGVIICMMIILFSRGNNGYARVEDMQGKDGRGHSSTPLVSMGKGGKKKKKSGNGSRSAVSDSEGIFGRI